MRESACTCLLYTSKEVARLAISDACTGSNPRQPSQEDMEKLLLAVYNDEDIDF